jgi:hypothetical protein
LHNRSDAPARRVVVMLPAFDWAWFSQHVGSRQAVILITLATIAIVALLVAGAAYLSGQRRRPRRTVDDEELFTSMPFAIPTDELGRQGRVSPHHAFSTLRLPRWVQAGTLLVALAITWTVARRLEPNNGLSVTSDEKAIARSADRSRDQAEDSPEDMDLSPDASPTFAFRVRDWVALGGGGCTGRLEVTKAEPNARSLTARVHDGQGQLIDTARARVAGLRQGDVVEFAFPRADCNRIGAWDVRGARLGP